MQARNEISGRMGPERAARVSYKEVEKGAGMPQDEPSTSGSERRRSSPMRKRSTYRSVWLKDAKVEKLK